MNHTSNNDLHTLHGNQSLALSVHRTLLLSIIVPRTRRLTCLAIQLFYQWWETIKCCGIRHINFKPTVVQQVHQDILQLVQHTSHSSLAWLMQWQEPTLRESWLLRYLEKSWSTPWQKRMRPAKLSTIHQPTLTARIKLNKLESSMIQPDRNTLEYTGSVLGRTHLAVWTIPMQNLYDTETNFSRNKEKQAEWEIKVDLLLWWERMIVAFQIWKFRRQRANKLFIQYTIHIRNISHYSFSHSLS